MVCGEEVVMVGIPLLQKWKINIRYLTWRTGELSRGNAFQHLPSFFHGFVCLLGPFIGRHSGSGEGQPIWSFEWPGFVSRVELTFWKLSMDFFSLCFRKSPVILCPWWYSNAWKACAHPETTAQREGSCHKGKILTWNEACLRCEISQNLTYSELQAPERWGLTNELAPDANQKLLAILKISN